MEELEKRLKSLSLSQDFPSVSDVKVVTLQEVVKTRGNAVKIYTDPPPRHFQCFWSETLAYVPEEGTQVEIKYRIHRKDGSAYAHAWIESIKPLYNSA